MVYVDGFYAGIVDDFDGFFQRLPLPPGGHDIGLYLDGYRSFRQRLYLAPGSSLNLHHTMERLSAGEAIEPPPFTPPLPSPPPGTFLPPRTPPRMPLPPPQAQAAPTSAAFGSLALRVQPGNADMTIDAERWVSSDGEHFLVQVPAGRHRVEAH